MGDHNCYIYRLCDDIELMIGSRPGYFWLLCWRFIGPIAMVVIFVASLIEIFSKGVSYEVWNSLKVCDRQFIFGTVHLMIRNQKASGHKSIFKNKGPYYSIVHVTYFVFFKLILVKLSAILCAEIDKMYIYSGSAYFVYHILNNFAAQQKTTDFFPPTFL